MDQLQIETGHLPKLEAQFIDYVLHTESLTEDIADQLNEAEYAGEAIEIVSCYLSDSFNTIEEELRDEACEDSIDIEEAFGVHLDRYIAECFEVTANYTVEQIIEPDFETCAIRCIAAFAEQQMGGVDKLFALFNEEK